MLRIANFLILLLGTCGYALWRGGAPERIAAGAMLAATIASAVFRSDIDGRFIDLEVGLFLVDAILLAVLLAVMLRADRGWPILICALHLCTVGAHGVKLIDSEMIRVTYVVMVTAWSWPMVIALGVGTWRHRRRLLINGHDRDWSAPIASEEGSTASA
ncbi:MAG: hypothetical protein ACTHJU_08300 [Sphingopyxis sp.]